jgi:hypothetical protein
MPPRGTGLTAKQLETLRLLTLRAKENGQLLASSSGEEGASPEPRKSRRKEKEKGAEAAEESEEPEDSPVRKTVKAKGLKKGKKAVVVVASAEEESSLHSEESRERQRRREKRKKSKDKSQSGSKRKRTPTSSAEDDDDDSRGKTEESESEEEGREREQSRKGTSASVEDSSQKRVEVARILKLRFGDWPYEKDPVQQWRLETISLIGDAGAGLAVTAAMLSAFLPETLSSRDWPAIRGRLLRDLDDMQHRATFLVEFLDKRTSLAKSGSNKERSATIEMYNSEISIFRSERQADAEVWSAALKRAKAAGSVSQYRASNGAVLRRSGSSSESSGDHPRASRPNCSTCKKRHLGVCRLLAAKTASKAAKKGKQKAKHKSKSKKKKKRGGGSSSQ